MAKIKPINIGGVMVSNATLHNEEEIIRKDIRVGDTVLLAHATGTIRCYVSDADSGTDSNITCLPYDSASLTGSGMASGGAVPCPFDCWLLLRSTKTMELRVQRQSDNAKEIAKRLQKSGIIDCVIYPGLESHAQHEIAVRQQVNPDGHPIFGSMISIKCEGCPLKSPLAKIFFGQ